MNNIKFIISGCNNLFAPEITVGVASREDVTLRLLIEQVKPPSQYRFNKVEQLGNVLSAPFEWFKQRASSKERNILVRLAALVGALAVAILALPGIIFRKLGERSNPNTERLKTVQQLLTQLNTHVDLYYQTFESTGLTQKVYGFKIPSEKINQLMSMNDSAIKITPDTFTKNIIKDLKTGLQSTFQIDEDAVEALLMASPNAFKKVRNKKIREAGQLIDCFRLLWNEAVSQILNDKFDDDTVKIFGKTLDKLSKFASCRKLPLIGRCYLVTYQGAKNAIPHESVRKITETLELYNSKVKEVTM